MTTSDIQINQYQQNHNHPFEEALEDCFLLLQSPLLKVGRKNNQNAIGDDDGYEDGDEMLTQQAGTIWYFICLKGWFSFDWNCFFHLYFSRLK